MKVEISPEEQDSLPTHRGLYYTRMTKRGPVIQRWPRKGLRKNDEGVKWQSGLFSIAGYMAARPHWLDQYAAMYSSIDTHQVPRDHLTAAAYGRLFDIIDKDGSVWPVVDSAIPVPDPPAPQPEGSAMWQWGRWDNAGEGGTDTGAQAAKGNVLQMPVDTIIGGVRAFATYAIGTDYMLTVAALDVTNTITAIYSQHTATANVNGRNLMQFEANAEVPAMEKVAILLSRPGFGDTVSIPVGMSTAAWYLFPCFAWWRARLAKHTPAIGDTVSVTASGCMPMGFLVL